MLNAAEDEVIPRAATEKLARALGIEQRVTWFEGLGHYTAMAAFPQALATTADFFAADLPPEARPPAAPAVARTPAQTIGRLLGQVGALLSVAPEAGRGHFVDLTFSAAQADGRRIEGSVRLVRGHGGRFALRADVPGWGDAALGQGAFPWLASKEGVVFEGMLKPGAAPRDLLETIDPEQLVKLRAAAGALGGIAMVPEMLERWVAIAREEPDAPGERLVRIERKDRPGDHARLMLQADGATPRRIEFDVEGVKGVIDVRAWQIGTVAHESLFEPPADAPRRRVAAEDLYRMFGAAMNFALETF